MSFGLIYIMLAMVFVIFVALITFGYFTFKRNRQQIEELSIKAESISGRRDGFIRFVGHELRGPLGAHRNLLATMPMRPNLDQQTQLELFELYKSATLMQLFADNILFIAEIKAKQRNVNLTPTNIYPIALQAIEPLELFCKTNDITIQNELDLHTSLTADSQIARLMFSNIFTYFITKMGNGGFAQLSASKNGENPVMVFTFSQEDLSLGSVDEVTNIELWLSNQSGVAPHPEQLQLYCFYLGAKLNQLEVQLSNSRNGEYRFSLLRK